MRKQNFEDLFKDPLGACLAYSSSANRYSGNGNVPGFYVGLCDGPSAYYTDKDYYGRGGAPFGTFVLFLCMETRNVMTYEDFNLGVMQGHAKFPDYHGNDGSTLDSRVVKDPTVMLPIGLAYAA